MYRRLVLLLLVILLAISSTGCQTESLENSHDNKIETGDKSIKDLPELPKDEQLFILESIRILDSTDDLFLQMVEDYKDPIFFEQEDELEILFREFGHLEVPKSREGLEYEEFYKASIDYLIPMMEQVKVFRDMRSGPLDLDIDDRKDIKDSINKMIVNEKLSSEIFGKIINTLTIEYKKFW